MKTIKEALEAIRAIATNWISDHDTDGSTAMSEVACVLLNTRFDEPEPIISLSAFEDEDKELTQKLEALAGQNIYEGITDPDVLVRLEAYVRGAEHKPGTWADTRQSMGGICTAGSQFYVFTPTKEDSWASFSYKRDAFLAVEAVNALPELIDTIRNLRDGIAARQAVINAQHDEITELRAKVERLDRAEAKAEARVDVIGQTGNTGEHYAELAIQKGGKPVDELPDGLTWDQAPGWAMVLVRHAVTGLYWAEKLMDGAKIAVVASVSPWIGTIPAGQSSNCTVIATRPAPADGRDATQA